MKIEIYGAESPLLFEKRDLIQLVFVDDVLVSITSNDDIPGIRAVSSYVSTGYSGVNKPIALGNSVSEMLRKAARDGFIVSLTQSYLPGYMIALGEVK